MKFKLFFSAFTMSILLYACNGNNSSSNNTTEKTSKVEIKGQVVFAQKCAACHGSDGTAGIGNAANLQTSKLDTVSVAKTIADGKAGMPPFKEQLTKEELTDLANFMLTLRK